MRKKHDTHISFSCTISISGTTLGSKGYAPSSVMPGGFTLIGGGAMVGHGLGLHHANKFDTISNIHKRGERGEWHLRQSGFCLIWNFR